MRTPQEEQILAMRTIEWKRPEEILKELNKDEQNLKRRRRSDGESV